MTVLERYASLARAVDACDWYCVQYRGRSVFNVRRVPGATGFDYAVVQQ